MQQEERTAVYIVHLLVHDPEVVLYLLIVGVVVLDDVHGVIQVHELGRRVPRVPHWVVQRRRRVGKLQRHPHPLRHVPAPERHREPGVTEQLPGDALEEVDVGAVEREEEPGEVHLDGQLRVADLPVRTRRCSRRSGCSPAGRSCAGRFATAPSSTRSRACT